MTEPETIASATFYPGDCMEVLPTLADNSIDACVTDPPYHLTSIVKRFGSETAAPAKSDGATGVYARASSGFMGKKWDGGDIAFRPDVWREVFRVLKPGAHLCAFGGTRTYHRMVCAIEDAGFEVRDCIQWIYGSGFPKSLNIGDGFGTALKPACEPIVLARKPLIGTVAQNILEHGTGALNIDGCRVSIGDVDNPSRLQRQQSNRDTWEGGKASGFKPDHTQTLYSTKGRWPANVIHDGSEEVVEAFPESDGNSNKNLTEGNAGWGGRLRTMEGMGRGDSGSAARFFYTAKADSDDRLGSKHPTVKPLDLIQYLVRLITPPKGLVLDPFAGTGTLGEAAFREGMSSILIEHEPEYQEDIRRRMRLVLAGPDERTRESIKAHG